MTGKIIKWMEKEPLFGLMKENTKASTKMIKKKDMDFLVGKFNFLFRNDGRKYKGKWKNGKQYGEG